MVMMNPPGSRPGINSLAITPTTKPNRIKLRNESIYVPSQKLPLTSLGHPSAAGFRTNRMHSLGQLVCQGQLAFQVNLQPLEKKERFVYHV
jgi:hypothetical protein